MRIDALSTRWLLNFDNQVYESGQKRVCTKLPSNLLATMIIMPRTTIFIADLAADCFRVTPRKAPMNDRRNMPMRIEAETE